MLSLCWQKSSRSVEDCIEARLGPDWGKSSRSYTDSCVEARVALAGVEVRDSMDSTGPVLRFGPNEWAGFLNGLGRERTNR